ncbi:hypothetical protein [Microbacterium sp. T2.11-28]|uniref:hypothetical protein n=1 Tax=Microbacterium sp. T2.11-28 TaxID=3041169 RepID=UPI0024778F3D|nr:hypothetical protein [Microbacterium sp. T2.11-28]CAI9388195.1 hypothetical protein MICABA_02977 [Microbacterium sp. T2.11-28]
MSEASNDLSGWLFEGWSEDSPIAIVEGFSGTGKTRAAIQYLRGWGAKKILLSLPEDMLYEDFLFTIVSELENAGIREVADAADWEHALLSLIGSGELLLVLDDFEKSLDADGVVTSVELRSLLTKIAALPQGRTCVLSSRSPAPDSWTDRAAFRTVRQLSPDEGSRILRTLLDERDLIGEVTDGLVTEVSTWLGNNPRAMRAFVACLMGEPLEEIIERDRESWDLRNTPRSRHLIAELEKEFWYKTIGRLDAEAIALAENLSVFRRPFRADAIEAAGHTNSAWESARNRLSRGFLLDRSGAWYELNPIVRQLCGASLSINTRRLTVAHARAADYFARRLDARAYRDEARSGAAFVEARFHYLEGGHPERVDEIAKQHRGLLLRAYRGLDVNLADPKKARERIPVLLAALDHDDAGYGNLRAALVRLLEVRASEGDDIIALRHALLASRERTPTAFWRAYVRIASRQETDPFLVALSRRALDNCLDRPESVVVAIAHVLFRRGNTVEAHRVIDDALGRLGGDAQFYLVRMKSFLFDRSGRFDEAFEVSLGSHRNGVRSRVGDRLVEETTFLAYQQGSAKRLAEIAAYAAAAEPPLSRRSSTLALMLTEMLRGDFARAEAIGTPDISDPAVASQVAFCRLTLGDIDGAVSLVSGFGARNSATFWLNGLIALCAGDADSYMDAMERSRADGVGGEARSWDEVLAEKYWLWIWDNIPEDLRPYPAYYFPRLPAQLLGTERDLVRTHAKGSVAQAIEDLNPSLPSKLPTIPPIPHAPAVRESPEGSPIIYVQEGKFEMSSDQYINNGQVAAMGQKAKVEGDVTQTLVNALSVSDALRALAAHARAVGDNHVATTLDATLELEEASDRVGAGNRFQAAARWVGDKLADGSMAVAAGVVLRALGAA